MAMSLEDLARELADIDNPITHSTEGLDDECFFCGAWSKSVYIDSDFHHFAEHRSRCLWVRARQAFDMGLGRNTIRVRDV